MLHYVGQEAGETGGLLLHKQRSSYYNNKNNYVFFLVKMQKYTQKYTEKESGSERTHNLNPFPYGFQTSLSKALHISVVCSMPIPGLPCFSDTDNGSFSAWMRAQNG